MRVVGFPGGYELYAGWRFPVVVISLTFRRDGPIFVSGERTENLNPFIHSMVQLLPFLESLRRSWRTTSTRKVVSRFPIACVLGSTRIFYRDNYLPEVQMNAPDESGESSWPVLAARVGALLPLNSLDPSAISFLQGEGTQGTWFSACSGGADSVLSTLLALLKALQKEKGWEINFFLMLEKLILLFI
mgnify:CR=1 FL=1